MAGRPLKRARKLIESGAIPVVVEDQRARSRDPEWVEKAWQAYLKNPTVFGLAQDIGCSHSVALRLVERGSALSLPFAARLYAVNQERAKATRKSDVERLEQNLALLGRATDADEDLMEVVAAAGKAQRAKLADEPDPIMRSKLMTAVVDPDLTAKVTKNAATRAETFQAVVERRPIGQGEDPAQAVASIFRGLLGGLRGAAERAGKLEPKAIEAAPADETSNTGGDE